MQCPEREMDTVGKRTSGADVQPVASSGTSPDKEAIGCKPLRKDDSKDGNRSHEFSKIKCESDEFSKIKCESDEFSKIKCESDEFSKIKCESDEFSKIKCESDEFSKSKYESHVKSNLDGYRSHKFSVNKCESHVKSDLDTISLSIDSRDTRKLKFLIDTGAEI